MVAGTEARPQLEAALYLASTLEARETRRRLAAVARGECSLVYVAPERLALPGFRALVADLECPRLRERNGSRLLRFPGLEWTNLLAANGGRRVGPPAYQACAVFGSRRTKASSTPSRSPAGSAKESLRGASDHSGAWWGRATCATSWIRSRPASPS